MTIATTAAAQTTQGNGATTQFPYAFKIPGASATDQTNVQVTVVDTTVSPATTTILAANQYSINGIGAAGGGAVTYPLSGPNPAAGVFVTVARAVPNVQTTQVPNGGNFNGVVLEAAYDYIVMLVQQLQAQVSRCFQVAVSDSSGVNPAIVADTAIRKNQNAAFDATGNLIPGGAVAGGIAINAAMTGLVQAASVSAAQTFLGMSAYFKTLLGALTGPALGVLIGGAAAELLGSTVIDDPASLGNLTTKAPLNAQTGAAYAVVAGDRGKLVTRSNAGAMADTIPSGVTLPAGWWCDLSNLTSGTGFVTLTPAAGTIDGLAKLILTPGQAVRIYSDGANLQVFYNGKVAQVVTAIVTAASTGTTLIPIDDTIPQSTEGDQYLTVTMTPTNPNSTLIIEVELNVSMASAAECALAIFQDAGVNAIAAWKGYVASGTTASVTQRQRKIITGGLVAGTATTFKVRAGPVSADTITLNGASGARLFGGVAGSSITVTEILP